MTKKFLKLKIPKISLKQFGKKSFASFLILALIVGTSFIFPNTANAAQVTSFQVLLTREKAATLSNQTILFTVPAALAANETLLLTYDNSTGVPAAFDFEDIDLSYDTTPDFVCDTGDTEMTLAAAPSGTTMGVVDTSTTLITFTNGSTTIASGSEICIEIGTNAETGVTGVEQITNGTAGSSTLVLSGTWGTAGTGAISGTAAMSIIANEQVVITATVAPTITFTVSDNTIEFGTLSSSAATWADNAGGSTTDVAAHTLTAATNATGGYIVSYNGATLTSGSDTIDVASLTNDADGVQGSESFGLGISTDGNATITTGYDHNATAGSRDWAWVASTTTTIITETGPTATETFSAYYLANIAATTEAGAYSTTATYIATGTF